MTKPFLNAYYDPQRTAQALADGEHRDWVGGMWEEIGRMQFEFLRDQGLRRQDRVLDLGCGCFRGGVHIVDYLDPGRYYGIDISQELLDVGYEREIIPAGLHEKLPRENLLSDDGFRAGAFGERFDVALAQSVFTHLPLNHFQLCMARLSAAMRPGGRFYVTAFICPEGSDWTEPLRHERGGITTNPAQDPFHYRLQDFEHGIRGLPWKMQHHGDWGHPRDQSMLIFTRTDAQ